MHHATLSACAALGPAERATQRVLGFAHPRLAVEVGGLRFPGPVGLGGGFDKNGIAVRRALALNLEPIHGDESALQQVVMNLLTNARDALGSGGEISLETSLVPGRPGMARLTVHDSGPGILPDVLSRIFDPFYTTKSEGTGLGLSISYGIVRDHKGTIDVESLPGQGATFVLTFPIEGEDMPT